MKMKGKTKAIINFIVGIALLLSTFAIAIFCPAEVLYSESGIFGLIYLLGSIILGSTLISVSLEKFITK